MVRSAPSARPVPADSDRMHLAFATSRFYLFKPAVIAVNYRSAASKSSTISAAMPVREGW